MVYFLPLPSDTMVKKEKNRDKSSSKYFINMSQSNTAASEWCLKVDASKSLSKQPHQPVMHPGHLGHALLTLQAQREKISYCVPLCDHSLLRFWNTCVKNITQLKCQGKGKHGVLAQGTSKRRKFLEGKKLSGGLERQVGALGDE